MDATQKRKKIISFSNITTALLIIAAVSLFIFPQFKATLLQGLMKVGLFQPSTSALTSEGASVQNWNVQFTDSKGRVVDGNELAGKVTFINIWATWCPPCIAEMSSINELYKEYKSNEAIDFILIDADNNFATSEKFMRDKGFELPVYVSSSGLPESWYDGSLPTTIVLNKKGNIVYKHAGVANYHSEKFKQFISKLARE